MKAMLYSQVGVYVTSMVVTVCLIADARAWQPIESDKIQDGATSAQKKSRDRAHVNRSIRGRVVWMADALTRRYGIQSVSEAAQRVLALETPKGELIPILEDIRGGAFRRDKRLREMDVELLVRQYHGFPFVQVIQVFEIQGNEKYEVDYWCEICAIAMFELKPCDCCQGEIELRRRKVAKQ